MSRKVRDPVHSLQRFMIGIYSYYVDRGIPPVTAKARMLKETLSTCFDMYKNEDEIPDHLLVLFSQFLHRAMNYRGSTLTKKVKEHYPASLSEEEKDQIIASLRQIKLLTDELEKFIAEYKGDELGKKF